jgi:hypothetical protein
MLEMIQAREVDRLIVLDLPDAFRFPDVGELPAEVGVSYRGIRVQRGCSAEGKCSPDGRVSVVIARNGTGPAPDVGLSEIRIRTLPPIEQHPG